MVIKSMTLRTFLPLLKYISFMNMYTQNRKHNFHAVIFFALFINNNSHAYKEHTTQMAVCPLLYGGQLRAPHWYETG